MPIRVAVLFVLSAVAFGLALVSSGRPALAQAGILEKRIPTYSVAGADMHIALERLANNEKLPIGFEAITEKIDSTVRTFEINKENATVREIVTAIVASDPRYQWKEEDGVINVFPVRQQETILDVRLLEFEVSKLHRMDALNALVNHATVKAKTKHLGIIMNNSMEYQPDYEHLRRLTFSLHNTTVRQVLNKIIKDGDGYYWLFQIYGSRYGGDDKYFMITL